MHLKMDIDLTLIMGKKAVNCFVGVGGMVKAKKVVVHGGCDCS